MGKSKLDPEDIDLRDIFKTTISFKGEAKTFIQELSNKKSDLVNYLIVDSLRSGVIVDFLKLYYTSDKVSELAKKYGIRDISNKTQIVDGSPDTKFDEKNTFTNSDEIAVNSGESARLILVNKSKQMDTKSNGGNNGFDF